MSSENSTFLLSFNTENHCVMVTLIQLICIVLIFSFFGVQSRVSVQGVKSLGGYFACLCRGFEFYEVKKENFCYYFSKRKWKYFYTFNHFCSEKSSKRAK